MSELVLKSMRETFCFVQIFERRFAARQLESYGEEQKKELAAAALGHLPYGGCPKWDILFLLDEEILHLIHEL